MKNNVRVFFRFLQTLPALLLSATILLSSGCQSSGSSDETETSPDTSTTPILSEYYGKLTDESMKSKAYTLEYLIDGEWVNFDVMAVNTMRWSAWDTEYAVGAFAHLRSHEESVRVRITKRGIREWNVRPAELVSDVKAESGKVEFTIQNGASVSVEGGGNLANNLIVRLSLPADVESTGSVECTSVYRLGPGVHTVENCDRIWMFEGMPTFRLKSGEQVVLEEGAVLKARVLGVGVKNVAITGTGIIDMTEWNHSPEGSDTRHDAIFLDNYSQNVYIGDITIRNSAFFCVRAHGICNLEVNGLSAFTGVFEGDGIDLHGAVSVKISNCLLRNSDDAIALYPSRTDIRDVEVNNCVLWSDRAHAINMGVHGTGRPNDRHYIENVSFTNMRVIEACCPSKDYQGAVGISLGDESICRNVTFENIVVEELSESQLFVLKVMKLSPWNKTPGYLIENVTLRNIIFRGDNKNGSAIYGYDENRVVIGVTIENLQIGGQRMTSLEEAGIRTNGFVYNVTMK